MAIGNIIGSNIFNMFGGIGHPRSYSSGQFWQGSVTQRLFHHDRPGLASWFYLLYSHTEDFIEFMASY